MRAPVRALVVGGATALCLGGLSAPAWSAPADLCATGTTFTIAPTTQTDLADEARTALEAKGLVEDVDGTITVTIASVGDLTNGSDPTPALALTSGSVDPAALTQDEDWAVVADGEVAAAIDELYGGTCEDVDTTPRPTPTPSAELRLEAAKAPAQAPAAAPVTAPARPQAAAPKASAPQAASPKAASPKAASPKAASPKAAAPAAAAPKAAAPAAAPAAPTLDDRDCDDFATQREAQAFFDANDPANDPHLLDRDGDQIACEANADGSSDRSTAAYIDAGLVDGANLPGVAGGAALVVAGLGVGLRARRRS